MLERSDIESLHRKKRKMVDQSCVKKWDEWLNVWTKPINLPSIRTKICS